ncbi:uncharacterized protein LOC127706385 [Mytilus californianus]|uniref:uncharacterized protein LOC127706385 n=1 Tax=Mytilus californianus TaxID=6549 RepID=UPI002245DCE0|nr:uncharacterized protein LOC127706385 [Mytilus californianus]
MIFERSIPILILFSIYLAWLVCKAVAFNCITWDVIQDDLNLIYRTDDFLKPVSLKDNNGNETMCSFEKTTYHCHHIPMFGVINPNINRNEIIFTIEDVKSKDVDGTWYISQGGKTFSTTVSLTNGFIGSTDIYITGEVNISKVTVRCFACRAPYGKNVEFLINDRSEDSLTLNSTTGKCTHQAGECNPEICSCSPSGNEFSRSFHLKNTRETVNFSCDMMFVDRTVTSWFSKYATLFYDGTDVHSKETKTNKKNSSENSNKTKDYAGKDFTGPLIGICLLVIVFITVVAVIVVCKKSRTKHNMKPVLHRQEEATPLCSNISQSREDLQSLKVATGPEIHTQVEKHVIGMENDQTNKIVQESEEELAPQINNQGVKYIIGKESTQANDIIQKSEDEIALQMNNHGEKHVIGEESTQANGIDQKSEDELAPHRNSQGEKYVIKEESTHANEIVQKSEDELALQMNNHVVENVIREESTQANEILQLPEEESYIYHVNSKQRPKLPARPFDAVFVNFDVDIERTWVERVVDMLEKIYNLNCGLIGRDFLLGLQMGNSFQFIEKHTPVVVTFSEKSGRMHTTIRDFEDIEKLVVVMVEECSLPIVRTNMKCIDATKDIEMWLEQLLYALHCTIDVKTFKTGKDSFEIGIALND